MNHETLRATIPALDHGIYFNTGAGGPSSRRVVDAVESALESHEYETPIAEGMYGPMGDRHESTKEAVADLLGTAPEAIALTESTTDGINRVAGALDWDDDDTVVRTDLEHPSGILPWRKLERTRGIDVRVLDTEAGRLDLDGVKAAADDATLVVVSSITWTHGTRLPIAEIVDIAHDAGAMVLVDAVQSPGQTAVDVEAWGADFVVGAAHKWLLGPFGAGFLYVRPGVERDLLPSAIGYRSVDKATAHEYEYAPGAGRFEVGTTSPALYAGLEEAIAVHEELGIDAVESRIERLTDYLKAELPAERLLSPCEFESGFVTIAADDPASEVDRLASHDIRVRDLPYPEALRVSVHAFNTREDIDRLLALV